MSNDNFTKAAHAEASRRFPSGAPVSSRINAEQKAGRAGFIGGAAWARDHLAAQEPTNAEVEAAARVICEGTEAGDLAEWGPETQRRFRSTARAALSAARATRRDERDTP